MHASTEYLAILCLFVYFWGVTEAYELFVGKTENKIGSFLCALIYPISTPIVLMIIFMRGVLTHGNNSKS